MLEAIKQWLASDKDFFSGRIIYRKIPDANQRLLELLYKGPTPFSIQKLEQALRAAYLHLQASQTLQASDTGLRVRTVTLKAQEPAEQIPVTTELTPPLNTELYNACKSAADTRYKEVMNLRAVLFASAAPSISEDVNRPDKIAERRQMAIDVVKGFREVSDMYDQADYVKKNGQLPHSEPVDEDSIDDIPDIMVKQTLDNARKNYNKMVKREQTPERIALQQQHALKIKLLEERWLLLKPKK